jgi:hypothetical protein
MFSALYFAGFPAIKISSIGHQKSKAQPSESIPLCSTAPGPLQQRKHGDYHAEIHWVPLSGPYSPPPKVETRTSKRLPRCSRRKKIGCFAEIRRFFYNILRGRRTDFRPFSMAAAPRRIKMQSDSARLSPSAFARASYLPCIRRSFTGPCWPQSGN